MLDREKVIKYFFVKAIKDEIAEEICNSTLKISDIATYNATVADRILIRFIDYTLPIFTLNEIAYYLRKILIENKD